MHCSPGFFSGSVYRSQIPPLGPSAAKVFHSHLSALLPRILDGYGTALPAEGSDGVGPPHRTTEDGRGGGSTSPL